MGAVSLALIGALTYSLDSHKNRRSGAAWMQYRFQRDIGRPITCVGSQIARVKSATPYPRAVSRRTSEPVSISDVQINARVVQSMRAS